MQLSYPALPVGQSVNHNVATWITPLLPGRGPVRFIRIGDMERPMELTVPVAPSDNILPLGSPVVTRALLGPYWLCAQCNSIASIYLPISK